MDTTVIEDEISLDELLRMCRRRSELYGLLARLYRVEVDEPLLTQMRTMRFPARTGNELLDRGYRKLTTYLSNVWENSLTELAVDYTRTFLGGGLDAFSAAYPFESVYTSEKRLLMQEARDEVLAIYRAAGKDKDETWKEGEDHIALELEFVQVLIDRCIAALEKGDEDSALCLFDQQFSFVQRHLYSWFSMMASDMRKFAKTEFYQGLADITEGFLETDVLMLRQFDRSAEERGSSEGA